MFLSFLDLNTQPGDEEKDILESTLTQVKGDGVVEQQNLEPERMDIEKPFNWKNQLHMHETN